MHAITFFFFLIEFYIINVLIDTYKQKNIYIIKIFNKPTQLLYGV